MAIISKHSKLYGEVTTIRLIAAQIFVLSVLSIWSGSAIIVIFMIVDFAVRAFSYATSPLKWTGSKLVKLTGTTPKPVFLPPKKFAALLGFIFSVLWLLLLLLGRPDYALLVGAALVLFSFLESVFQICFGCYIYNWVVAPLLQKRRQ